MPFRLRMHILAGCVLLARRRHDHIDPRSWELSPWISPVRHPYRRPTATGSSSTNARQSGQHRLGPHGIDLPA